MGYVFVIGVIEIIFSAKDSFCRILNNTSTLILFSPFIKFNPRSKINSTRFLLAFWIVTPTPIFVLTNSVCNPAASISSSNGALPLSEAMYKTLVGLVYIAIKKNLLSLTSRQSPTLIVSFLILFRPNAHSHHLLLQSHTKPNQYPFQLIEHSFSLLV